MSVTDRANLAIYRQWAPVYDLIFDRLLFARARRQSMRTLAVRSGERVLLPGVGTGADLPLLPVHAVAIAVDLSPAMLAQAQRRLGDCAATVLLVQGDAQRLPVADGAADAAVPHLVLSVVPDGSACAAETARCLREGGRAVVFDKFVAEGAAGLSPLRRLLNRGQCDWAPISRAGWGTCWPAAGWRWWRMRRPCWAGRIALCGWCGGAAKGGQRGGIIHLRTLISKITVFALR
jgi:SAM-dependent methyltransferase